MANLARKAALVTAFSVGLGAADEHVLPPGIVPFPRGFAFGRNGRLLLVSGGPIQPSRLVTDSELSLSISRADFISSDLWDASSACEVAKRAIEFGNSRVDILINNAGIYPFGPTLEMTEELYRSRG